MLGQEGELHHFNPKRIRGTPFNQKNYESIAWVAMGLAVRAIYQKIVEINQTGLNIEELIDLIINYKKNFAYNSGIEISNVVLQRDPKCKIAWELLGEIYEAKGDYKKAQECFLKLKENNH